MTQQLGTLAFEGSDTLITFTRSYAAAPEKVWKAIATQDGLAGWLATGTFESRLGGVVDFAFDEENNVAGEVTVWNPYSELTHTWVINGEVPSSLTYLLEPDGSGTKMTLVHSQLPEPMANGYTPGWHAFLGRLDQALDGVDPSSWDELFAAIAPQYMPQ
jgi:uncharacterized protein YndB with AHSA1/START domain